MLPGGLSIDKQVKSMRPHAKHRTFKSENRTMIDVACTCFMELIEFISYAKLSLYAYVSVMIITLRAPIVWYIKEQMPVFFHRILQYQFH